ncbi:MAG: cyclic pyranopterin monophosphate synthase MoaC [Chloroflexi bacterium]|nr:MAG: cyclic pyranopterin monophosphate synthase MoaC [Chloroflexota bacterium]
MAIELNGDVKLTHLDEEGRVQMVDVGAKADTERVAVAKGEVVMRPETLRLILEQGIPKGDVLAVAQVAGIMAAKRTPDLIPLCHPLLLTKADVDFHVEEEGSRIEITATVRCRGKTGVEMEALTAVSVAALTIYDMAKAVEKTMRIGNIRLVRKSGGKSGEWENDERMNERW